MVRHIVAVSIGGDDGSEFGIQVTVRAITIIIVIRATKHVFIRIDGVVDGRRCLGCNVKVRGRYSVLLWWQANSIAVRYGWQRGSVKGVCKVEKEL